MVNAHPHWQRIGKKTVYKGRLHIVEHDAVLPNGQPTTYEVDHSETGAVAVLIKVGKDKVILTRQYRFPLDRWIYDLPGGGIHKDETTEAAAIRECREEAGVAPKNIQKLNTFYPNPARTDWPAHVYFAEDFEESKIELGDPSENVETVFMSIVELKKLVDNQEIVDPMLLVAWYTARDKGLI